MLDPQTRFGYIDAITDGAHSLNSLEFAISPNPSDGRFVIKGNFNENRGLLIIRNLLGKPILYKDLGENENSIDISHCQDGFYFCEIRINKGNFVKKIEISHP